MTHTTRDLARLILDRDALRAKHSDLCDLINEGYNPFRGEVLSATTRQRDRTYAELELLEELVTAGLAAELAAEG